MDNWHQERQNFYKKAFTENICVKCTMCRPPIDPKFCLAQYAKDKEDFWKKMQYMIGLRFTNQKKFKDLFTYAGFCGTFCNSIIPCPRCSGPCQNISVQIACYESFIGQCGAKLAPKTRMQIYASYSGIETFMVGRDEYSIRVHDPLKLIKDKKDRKKVKKTVGKMRKKFGNSLKLAGLYATTNHKKSKIIKRRKKVTTAFFCNDGDKEWKKQIDAYLAK